MLVSDMPLQKRGIKDKKLQDEISTKYMDIHLNVAMDAVDQLNTKWGEVERKLTSEW